MVFKSKIRTGLMLTLVLVALLSIFLVTPGISPKTKMHCQLASMKANIKYLCEGNIKSIADEDTDFETKINREWAI